MFNFMKKSTVLAHDSGGCEERDGDKEKRKKEKKERKEREKRERIAAGLEEPLRLEEVRRSLKLRGRRKEKEKLPSGITADYTASLFAHLEQDSNYSSYPIISTSGSNSNLSDDNNHLSPGYPTPHNNWNKKEGILQSDSSETSLNSLNNPHNANSSPRQAQNLPPIPPRPPKRGILKGPRLSNTSSNSQENSVHNTDTVDHINGQDSNVVARNTQQNELISYRIPPSKSTSSSDDMQQIQNFTKKVIHSPVENQYKNYKNNANPSITTQDVDDIPKTNGNSYQGVTSTSPSADSLTDTTTNSSFATPPFSTSPVGESQGFHRWSRTSTFDDVYLPLPALKPLQLPKPRVLTIQRQKAPRNDFGFSLRRAMVQERVFIGDVKELSGHEENGLNNGEGKCNGNFMISKLTHKAVILAEPGSYPGASETGLLPGDRLIEVNGVNVEGKSREEVIELIKGSQDSVTIKVQPIAELCELSRRRAADGVEVELSDSNVRGGTLSRSGSRRFNTTQAKSEEQLACEKEWLQAGHMWLAHRGGFTAVVREGDADAGRAKVRVLQTGETLVADEDDLEKANPPQLERCEDIASLRCLNECGALNVLRSRFAAGLPHARAGHALLVLGPPRRTAPIYTEKVAAMFRGCRADDMPPHVFAAAQSAHRCMLASRRDRAIVFLGRSGSGKTSAMRHCVWYLASAYPSQGSKLTADRLNAAFDVLHAFGSSRTSSNPHASRFVSLTSLDFDGGGALVSASVQTLLPDFRPGQSPLRALHTLFHGSDGRLRRELLLDQAPVNAPNPFISSSDKAEAPAEFSALKEALQALSVTEPEQAVIWRILAAICHLGWSGVTKANVGSGLKYQFGSSGCASRAARLLGVALDELARAVFAAPAASPAPAPAPASASPQPPALRTPSPSSEREVPGSEALDAFVTGLYNETFNIVAALVNRSLSTSARTSASILLLDTPGADNPMCSGQQSGAPLSKLLSNYLQERLQAMFHDALLVAPRERYAQEGITLDDGSEEVNPGPMVELLDKSPQNSIVRSSQADLRDCDRRGLLWLLDEESMYPGSSDDSFLERVLSHYGAPQHTQYLIKKAPHARQFVLQHLQGTNPVLYDVTGWVKASRENPVTKKAHTILQESQNEDVGRLAGWARGACGVGAWSAAVGDASTLRRASSIRRTLTSAGMKRRSTALQAKFVADGVVDTLRRCGSGGVQFVCCLLTNQPSDMADDVNVPLLRSQFRGFQLLDAARLYKQGFPEHMPLSEFARRYRLLATSENETPENTQQTATLSDRQIVDDMLLALDLDVTSYRLGLTQIMFRGGVVGGLDARRDAALARVLVRLQARARGLLARRRAQRLRTQHTAARCVQRNVRAFLAVRDWPWWRLLVRVTPLLAVHRTEHRLKQAQEELETLRAKLEKVESERTHYKNETEKLETKLSELGGELAEERAAAALATERADAEAAERLRVERDNRDLVANNQRLQQASERLELELLHWRSAENGVEPSDSEGSEAESGIGSDKYKRRYEQAHRELQLLRAQLRRQHEDDLEQLVTVKKQLEKKVQDAYEEVEEQRAVAASWKRKLQKLTNDMADLRSLLDEQTCRNNLLEKRQRKFDAELQAANEELKRERASRERHARERDQALADKYALEQSLSEARLELELKEERLSAASRELEERGGGGDELAALRRARADLERRARDQEEELDDLAGQIQVLITAHHKEERLSAASRELEERGGGGDELAALRRARADLERRARDQEEELDDLAGQIQVLITAHHKEERLSAASRELEERGGGGDELAALRRARADLERRARDQEEELDDLAGQIQVLITAHHKEERLSAASRELEERGGGGDELAALRRARADLERRARDQEEELDDLAGQIQVLITAHHKEERLSAASRELEERGGGGDELAALRRARADLERRARDQEEELDDLAGQIQVLITAHHKEERLSAASRELEERGGGGDELAALRRARADLERRARDQEEELDDLAGQIQVLITAHHKEERLSAASRELEERGGGGDELAALRRARADLERRARDQEEELDDLAGQIQVLITAHHKEERLSAASRELEERGGGGDELAALRRARADLERRARDQEEELDDLAGQIQVLITAHHKEERLSAASRELEERGGGGDELAALRRARADLERRARDQEEELDDLAGQIQVLITAHHKEERLSAASRELEERGGGGDELAALRRARADLERRARDQEEELDDLAGQIQVLITAHHKEERLSAASRELEERGGGGDELAALRRARADLERRARDQEEELDDLAGQIQVLITAHHKEERLSAASRELEERGGGGDELAALRRARADLERRARDQEEELDDLAGQIQVLITAHHKEERLSAASRELEERGGGGDELAALRRARADLERRARDQEEELDDLAGQIQVLITAHHKEERLSAASRELEERGGGGDELAALRRARADLERRARDQEEELDDLAGQIQLLESSKLRLEMLLEQQRKEARLEAAARDDEMEETRANAAKKLKMLESQLESEHAERSLLLRERHELERRLAALEETARAENQEQAQLVQRLKRDLKRYRALLRDAQTMLEQKEKEGGAKAQIRQLKNQVEDLELAVRAASKARAAAEAEAAEAGAALEEAARARADAHERALAAARDAAAARAALDDAEEEAAELLKKYRSCSSALLAAQAEAREAAARGDAAAEDARQAKERLAELAQRLAHAEAGHSHSHGEAERRLELRNKELESCVELEATARGRLEGQLARLRDAHDALAAELTAARARDATHADELRKLQRAIRDLKEENASLTAKLGEVSRARAAAEAAAVAAAGEAAAARDEARLAARRVHALQEAIAGDLSSNNERDSDSDNDSYSSDESIGTFLANHKLSPSVPSRNSMQLDSQKSQTSEGRQSRSSVGSNSKPPSPSKESFA
ncbi:unnamed protein product [Parnassius mnemosyne]|uniref:Unconventional myosin-XVIIIa n=1 Tax=Parnassius mnemosyne TaxID=213953 RepID=A0AAV1L431_9NEOP